MKEKVTLKVTTKTTKEYRLQLKVVFFVTECEMLFEARIFLGHRDAEFKTTFGQSFIFVAEFDRRSVFARFIVHYQLRI